MLKTIFLDIINTPFLFNFTGTNIITQRGKKYI
nr:MAG TPA: hypothetical protein [Caudoviricetes sp.]